MKILPEMMVSEPSRAEDFAGVSFSFLLGYLYPATDADVPDHLGRAVGTTSIQCTSEGYQIALAD